MIVVIIGLIIIIGLLLWQLHKKVVIDTSKIQEYRNNINQLTKQYNDLQKDISNQNYIIQANNEKIKELQQEYENRNINLDQFFEQQKINRQAALDEDFTRQFQDKENALAAYVENYNNQVNQWNQEKEQFLIQYEQYKQQIDNNISKEEERFKSLLQPLKQYEKEKQDKVFYTIQIPEEYRPDINYLLKNVAPQLKHPDIINKLIWSEYIKPYIDDTFKRVGVESKPGIYKITNIIDNKAYIGKSTDIKKRIADHMKSAVGISTIADQAVHHAILEQGIWNWAIEPIIYSEKESLSELEKFYIDFFQTQTYGYNKKSGG